MDLRVPDCAPNNSGMKKRKQKRDALSNDHGNSMSLGESSGSGDLCKSSNSGSLNTNNPSGSNSQISGQDDELEDMNDDDADEDPDYGYGYYDNDDILFEDDYASMEDQFDSLDLPPGVEAPLPWLKDVASSECKQVVAFTCAELSSKGEVEEKATVKRKFGQFKQFDTVDAYPDHYYDKEGSEEPQRPKHWAKKIQEEWKILEENLPETIFVRVCETRMELLRAVVIGPEGTPYHDGLFFFDCFFPSTYPAGPPKVHYHSRGLRINPNLYENGKVCLSLLGTWPGSNSENWIPEKSTMLQVLVSMQALILNEKPFFNEPGYASTQTGSKGQRRSKEYNESTFVLSLKTMIYTLHTPPKHFEDLVSVHFHTRAYKILTACRSYAKGAPVGSVEHNLAQSSNNSTNNSQKEFQSALSSMMNTLIVLFTKNGSTDCEEFRSPEIHDELVDEASANLETHNI